MIGSNRNRTEFHHQAASELPLAHSGRSIHQSQQINERESLSQLANGEPRPKPTLNLQEKCRAASGEKFHRGCLNTIKQGPPGPAAEPARGAVFTAQRAPSVVSYYYDRKLGEQLPGGRGNTRQPYTASM